MFVFSKIRCEISDPIVRGLTLLSGSERTIVSVLKSIQTVVTVWLVCSFFAFPSFGQLTDEKDSKISDLQDFDIAFEKGRQQLSSGDVAAAIATVSPSIEWAFTEDNLNSVYRCRELWMALNFKVGAVNEVCEVAEASYEELMGIEGGFKYQVRALALWIAVVEGSSLDRTRLNAVLLDTVEAKAESIEALPYNTACPFLINAIHFFKRSEARWAEIIAFEILKNINHDISEGNDSTLLLELAKLAIEFEEINFSRKILEALKSQAVNGGVSMSKLENAEWGVLQQENRFDEAFQLAKASFERELSTDSLLMLAQSCRERGYDKELVAAWENGNYSRRLESVLENTIGTFIARAYWKLGQYEDALDLANSIITAAEKLDAQGSRWVVEAGLIAWLSAYDLKDWESEKVAKENYLRSEKTIVEAYIRTSSSENRMLWRNVYDPSLPIMTGSDDLEKAEHVVSYKNLVYEQLKKESSAVRRLETRMGMQKPVKDFRKYRSEAIKQRVSGDSVTAYEYESRANWIFRNDLEDSEYKNDSLFWLTTINQIEEALPKDCLALEYFRYTSYVGKGRFVSRYAAVGISKDGWIWRDLGTAELIEGLVNEWLRLVQARDSEPTRLEEVTSELSTILLGAFEELLHDAVARVYVSPDGELNRFPLAFLQLKNGNLLIQETEVIYLNATRDLAKMVDAEQATLESYLLVGGIDYYEDERYVPSSDVFVSALPGTKSEVEKVGDLLKQSGLKGVTLTEKAAGESAVRERINCDLVHFATHGFFLPPSQFKQVSNEGVKEIGGEAGMALNPMHRSLLALSGGGEGVARLTSGSVNDIRNDGLLSASEIQDINLEKVELCVLSACSTGLGGSVDGEAVLGLRSAFGLAGARSLLYTLWRIDDSFAVIFMQQYYENLSILSDKGLAYAVTVRGFIEDAENSGSAVSPRLLYLLSPFVYCEFR